ncbi:MAG: DUF4010 domain-containing protein, partial [bacterium]|nr:DUF4010 domain-containing protein [bacterium]
VLYLFNVGLAKASLPLLLSMMAAGLLLGIILMRLGEAASDGSGVTSQNPFRLLPAVKFGAVFAAVVFAGKAAAAEFGGKGLYWASALGGTVDADAVAVSIADLQSAGTVAMPVATEVLFVALLMNAVLKTGLAFFSGGAGFGWRVAVGFVVMFGAGSVFWLL